MMIGCADGHRLTEAAEFARLVGHRDEDSGVGTSGAAAGGGEGAGGEAPPPPPLLPGSPAAAASSRCCPAPLALRPPRNPYILNLDATDSDNSGTRVHASLNLHCQQPVLCRHIRTVSNCIHYFSIRVSYWLKSKYTISLESCV